jgi:flagellar basal-body rod protein FlgC
MIGGIYSGLSALQAIQKKVDSIANNTANVNTDGFKKTKVTLNEGPLKGVQAEVRKVETPGPLVYEQGPTGAELVEKSNVELSEEIPDMMLSKRSFQANVKTVQAAEEMLGYLLDIKG